MASRNNSITAEFTGGLSSAVAGMDCSLSDNSNGIEGVLRGGGTTGSRRRGSNSRMGGGRLGMSLNVLNLDHSGRDTRSSDMLRLPAKTVGGSSPRVALMQLRLQRLKKTSDTTERLYQSDSALFSSSAASAEDHNLKGSAGVWFKSQYPKVGSAKKGFSLEKLEEEEKEYLEDSQTSASANSPAANGAGNDLHNMSGTNLWLTDFGGDTKGEEDS